MLQGNHKVQSSKLKVQSQGRTELATRYFPYIQPRSAWLKLKSLLSEEPDLEHLTKLKRRTFLPAEVKHYLPASRTALNRLFRPFLSAFSFPSPKSDFPYLKLRLSSKESSILHRGAVCFISQIFKCQYFYKNPTYSVIHLFNYDIYILTFPEF